MAVGKPEALCKMKIGIKPEGYGILYPIPSKDSKGKLLFKDKPNFTPNLTPLQVLQAGAFGGGEFRDFYSSLNKQLYTEAYKELPDEWLSQLDIETLNQSIYNVNINKYKCKPENGFADNDDWGAEYWTSQGWIKEQDPYGWFMWYYRFYFGRRSDDDDRQIKKWNDHCGVEGRFRINLAGMCLVERKKFDDASVSPVLRQSMLHYAYEITEEDFINAGILVMQGASFIPRSFFPSQEEMSVILNLKK